MSIDLNSSTLLLTDGSTNTVIEVNPANPSVAPTTLFSGLPGRPTSIALSADATQVFVQIGNSIYVGPRSGGALSLFAVDKTLNTVYVTSVDSSNVESAPSNEVSAMFG